MDKYSPLSRDAILLLSNSNRQEGTTKFAGILLVVVGLALIVYFGYLANEYVPAIIGIFACFMGLYLFIQRPFKPAETNLIPFKKSVIIRQYIVRCLIFTAVISPLAFFVFFMIEAKLFETIIIGIFITINLWIIFDTIRNIIRFTRFGDTYLKIDRLKYQLGDSISLWIKNEKIPENLELTISFRNLWESYKSKNSNKGPICFIIYEKQKAGFADQQLTFDIPVNDVFPTYYDYKNPVYWEIAIENKDTGYFSRHIIPEISDSQ